jgi:uncharacterized protein (TIGR00375 family)
MQIISDLHIHSRFSRATSPQLNIPNLEKYAKIKGLDLLGTGDFTHPLWLKEIKEELSEQEQNGILKTKTGFPFILQTEISLMYSQGDKGRRIHLVILAPNLETVEQINSYLGKKGRLDYDGRPIFGMSCIEVIEQLKSISENIEIIPAHIWTPWFGVLGSKSGFDSFEQAFENQIKHIYALETGLSSDPEMNWRLSNLDKFTILSNSDCHSHWPWRIGREANIFNLKQLNYQDIIKAIRTRQGYQGTIEVDPAYGKYHYDGHRFCHFSCSPKEAREKYKNICPKCGKPLTIGVEHRVEELADRKQGYEPKDAMPFKKLLPLHEIISTIFQMGVATKKTWQEYNNLIEKFKNEFNILLEIPISELRKATSDKLAQAIIKNREGKIKVKPGFDGEYGQAIIETDKQEKLI